MTEAIIGLTGVIIGGIIGTIGQIILLCFDRKKWRKEATIKHLKTKKEQLEEKYKGYMEKLYKGMEKNSYNSEMVFDFKITFPKNVSDAFENMMRDKDKSFETKKTHSFLIISEMKKSLSEIDQQIEREINIKTKLK